MNDDTTPSSSQPLTRDELIARAEQPIELTFNLTTSQAAAFASGLVIARQVATRQAIKGMAAGSVGEAVLNLEIANAFGLAIEQITPVIDGLVEELRPSIDAEFGGTSDVRLREALGIIDG